MIICAALKIKDTDTVIGCIRHGFGYSSLHDLDPKIGCSKVIEGFLDNRGNFLDRYEAFIEAQNCGQLSATVIQSKIDNKESELYSEDLY